MGMEQRQFSRMNACISIGCRVDLPDSMKSWSRKGILRNISEGGLYFSCKTPLYVKPDTICDFNFTFTHPDKDSTDIDFLSIRGWVVRTEQPGLEFSPFGVAVKFARLLA